MCGVQYPTVDPTAVGAVSSVVAVHVVGCVAQFLDVRRQQININPMKNNYSLLEITMLAAFTLMAFGPCLEAQIYEYDWIGGEPGYSGKIFLDAPSSTSAPDGGTIVDVLAGSYLTTPLGDYANFDSAFSTLTAPWSPDVLWDQTHIIDMVLFFKPTTPINSPIYGGPTEALAQGGITKRAGNSRLASQLTIYDNSNSTIAGHARCRGCA